MSTANCQLVFLLFVFCFLFISCHKAGTGGNASLMVYPQHHDVPIINHVGYPDTVFLKFNVDELSGTRPSDYDVFYVGTPREDFIHCDGLKAGKYFVYAVGYDSFYMQRVSGGIPLKIKYSQRKEMIMVTVPVVE
ncbi:MAG: hypothetical protein HY840_00590 [Bacteroidetes bacterium]|nr:hypothetical protein [Bacteroidota bacterium]